MKKICLIMLISLFSIRSIKVNAETTDLAKNATSAIIIEASTGEIIWQKNADEKRAPASMTKMMSMLLIMENIEKGIISFDDEVTASLNASSMGGSQIFLETGEVMSVMDLLKGIAIGSGNDVVVTKKQSQVIEEEIIIKQHLNHML